MTDADDLIYETRRISMVKNQLEMRGISDSRLLEAMNKVKRHLFVKEASQYSAYEDRPLQIGEDQTISQPYMVAIMTQLLELTGVEKVLEIGTGSGYQTAILAELCAEVWTIERFDSLLQRARTCLNSLGYNNIHFKTGDGTIGWREHSPFDRIMVTAAAPQVPMKLYDQLARGGILIAPVGKRFIQTLYQVKKGKDDKMEIAQHGGCVFVPLVGEDGW